MTRRQGESDESAARPTRGRSVDLVADSIRALYWAVGGISMALTTLLIVVVFAISKADAAQATSNEVKQQQGVAANDIQWIKDALTRIEKEVKGK